MAVKQNNTEANAAPAPVNGNAVGGVNTTGGSMAGVTGGVGVGGNNGLTGMGVGVGGGTKTKKLNGKANLGAEISGNTDANEPGCSGVDNSAPNKPKLNMKAAPGSSGNIGGGGEAGNIGGQSSKNTTDITHILHLIELVELNQQHISFGSDIVKIYHHIINELARVQTPRQIPKELKRFKEDIVKVGAFFSKANEKRVYLFYLRVVCQLITQGEGEPPSCAIAIIFQLFSSEMVFEAVQSMLDHKIPEQNIRKTVKLLSEWLRMCNFCQNLNLWILAILRGLQEQQKFSLFRDIALDNIEPLFTSLILPVLRPKVYPIVCHMLSFIDQTPVVFHKILPKFPRVITYLKQQSNSQEEYAEETKKILQKLVDLTKSLMVRFYGYDDLYEAVELVMKDIPHSYDLPNYGSSTKNGDDNSTEIIPHESNAKVGLVNLGNTCYMNSVLQALAMTKEFSREILLSQSKSPLLMKMQQQIALMLYSTRFELTPSRVLSATRPPGFSPGLQQDSSEYLGYLLETLHEQETLFRKKQGSDMANAKKVIDDKKVVIADGEAAEPIAKSAKQAEQESGSTNSGEGATAYFNTAQAQHSYTRDSVTTDTINKSNDSSHTDVDEKIVVQTNASSSSDPCKDKAVATTTIDKTFTGKLATTYECLTCGWKSRIVDSFRDLQLSFPEVKNDCASNYSVQDLIDYYCSPEKLYGDNQYFCERCKKLSDAERYINVIGAPKNLILTLKHFKYDQKYHTRAKLMHKVFHDEKVSVKVCAEETLEEIASVHYDLYAGVVHSGFSMDSGHYYTYAADITNKWYKFNDNVVTQSKSEELHNLTPPNTPYILFYQMGARSNEVCSCEGSTTKVVKVDVPNLLSLDELSGDLRNYINHDNYIFAEEIKERIIKSGGRAALQSALAAKRSGNGRGGGGGRSDYDDDNDSDQPPPASGCGGNALDINVNRFVY
ncbi:PREDICTED: ubiquitin carboxyl-terminal hydrolase 35 [Bactrocera latifrons]|uniref:Ubiquitin carboxyl-terminal hydrolase 38 n=1 Tax=Bactrocera latifrons TaxID=174628 RepID=A0A0K8UX75_BACLA|nr:PREDICTED: ubiquitin carboxyl-terminal hydrolase 35 [Bactrocera latifrons]